MMVTVACRVNENVSDGRRSTGRPSERLHACERELRTTNTYKREVADAIRRESSRRVYRRHGTARHGAAQRSDGARCDGVHCPSVTNDAAVLKYLNP